jgi:hypothetical protein
MQCICSFGKPAASAPAKLRDFVSLSFPTKFRQAYYLSVHGRLQDKYFVHKIAYFQASIHPASSRLFIVGKRKGFLSCTKFN